MARKNTTDFADIPIAPLTGQMDLRSPSGSVPFGDFRLVLNASMNELRKRCRRVGFRKLGFDSPQGFNNQDLHDQLLTQDGCAGNADGCQNAGTITADPPSGSYVLAGTYIVLTNSNPNATTYYNVGSGDVLYEEPFQLPIGVTEVTAFNLIGEEECPDSAVTFTYHYSDEIIEFVELHLLCNTDDKAGVFFEFAPNGLSNDYIWELSFSKSETFNSKRLEMYETNPSGFWNTGQAWATANPIFPVEQDGAPFAVYPLVIIENDVQLNTEYTSDVVPDVGAGGHQWFLYGQPFVANVGYFKLIWTVVVEEEEYNIIVIHPNVCDCGYYDDSCCEYYDDEQGCYYPTSSDVLNIAFQSEGDTAKTGAAAVGEVGDFWNTFNFNPGGARSELDLLWADSTDAGFSIIEGNEFNESMSIFYVAGSTSHSDPMMQNNGKTPASNYVKRLVFNNIPRGRYNVYVYGHGSGDSEVLSCQVLTPSSETEFKSTSAGTGWAGSFTNGENYVKFENIGFQTNEETDLAIHFESSVNNFVSGIQLEKTT